MSNIDDKKMGETEKTDEETIEAETDSKVGLLAIWTFPPDIFPLTFPPDE